MAGIIKKRASLHRDIAKNRQLNRALKMQVSQLQALANIGVTTSMIAHEINNLLTPLSNYAVLALNNPEDSALADKALRKTAKNCERASKVMQSILAVANGETCEKRQTKLLGLVEEIFNCLCRDFSKDGISVEISIPEELAVWAVPVELQQVIMNLVLNARDAMLESGGTLKIEANETDYEVTIEVSDSGSGIDQEDIEKIFDPFFTTKSSSESGGNGNTSGSGLGLAFCRRVIDSHEGTINVESSLGLGTTFTITLPKQR